MSTLVAPWNGSVDFFGKMNGIDMSGILSERSQKFYNGTYQWDSDGFVDDQGVHRKFSDEPIARPPTPLPPAPLSVTSDDLQSERHDSEPVSPNNTLTFSKAGSRVLDQEDASGPPAPDLSDKEQIADPGPRQHGDIHQAGIEHEDGHREAASTPVNAPASALSDPVGPSALRAKVNELKKEKGDDDDDEDDDEKKRKNSTAKNDHGVAKTKKQKKKDEDDEDDADKENDGAAGGKESNTSAEDKGRKDSKATSTGGQSRKTSTVATNPASNVANADTKEEHQTPTNVKDVHPVTKTPAKKGRGRPPKRALADTTESPAKKPTVAKESPARKPPTARQLAIKTKKQAADISIAEISDKELSRGTPAVKLERTVDEDGNPMKTDGKNWVVAKDKDGSLIKDYDSPVKAEKSSD